uniref:Estradiol 17-beta-dehydrogenase 12 n=1 Tax=Lygus hesperus TaxID=30085 RepID=A0A0A9ZJS1_LYGHE
MIPFVADLVSCGFFGWVGVAVSVLWLLWLAEEVYRGFMNFVWSRIGPKKDFVKTYGKWAVVTGGSDGIGKGWAMEFAKRGMNICVISKDEFNITEEIRSKYPVEVKYINVDFSNPKVYDGLEKELSQLEIGVLANNVGMFLRDLELFFNTSRDNLDKMVEVNVKTVVMMTQMVLKKMVPRNKGLIINIGSLSSVLTFPIRHSLRSLQEFRRGVLLVSRS